MGLLLVILPFWTSYLLRVYSWVAILGDNGAINSLLKALGLTKEPIRLFLYDNPGVFIVLVYLYFPFAALTLYASLERFDWRLLHAAVDLGATADARHRQHPSAADAAGVGDGRNLRVHTDSR